MYKGVDAMDIQNMTESQKVYNLLKKDLGVTSMRSKVIANNIANINTANYKRYYVTFEDSLNNAQNQYKLKTTNPKHLQIAGSDYAEPQVLQDNTSVVNQDGNNVDIDNEMVNASANALMYNALINQANSRLTMERYVIQEK